MSHPYQSILDENPDFVSPDDDLSDVFGTAHYVLDRMYDELMSMEETNPLFVPLFDKFIKYCAITIVDF